MGGMEKSLLSMTSEVAWIREAGFRRGKNANRGAVKVVPSRKLKEKSEKGAEKEKVCTL